MAMGEGEILNRGRAKPSPRPPDCRCAAASQPIPPLVRWRWERGSNWSGGNQVPPEAPGCRGAAASRWDTSPCQIAMGEGARDLGGTWFPPRPRGLRGGLAMGTSPCQIATGEGENLRGANHVLPHRRVAAARRLPDRNPRSSGCGGGREELPWGRARPALATISHPLPSPPDKERCPSGGGRTAAIRGSRGRAKPSPDALAPPLPAYGLTRGGPRRETAAPRPLRVSGGTWFPSPPVRLTGGGIRWKATEEPPRSGNPGVRGRA